MTTWIFLGGITAAFLTGLTVLVAGALGMREAYRQEQEDRRHG